MSAAFRALTIQSGTTQRIGAAAFLDTGEGIKNTTATMGIGFDVAVAGALTIGGEAASLALTTNVGGTIDIGAANASTINIGKTGSQVNFPGIVNFTSTTASPDVHFEGDVVIGDAGTDTVMFNSMLINSTGGGWPANSTLVMNGTTDHWVRHQDATTGAAKALLFQSSASPDDNGGALWLMTGAGTKAGLVKGGNIEFLTGSGINTLSLETTSGSYATFAGGQSGEGGYIDLTGGDADGLPGGHVSLTAGGSSTAAGGAIDLVGGKNYTTGAGGAATLTGGEASTGTGGLAAVYGGLTTTGTGGGVTIRSGAGSVAGGVVGIDTGTGAAAAAINVGTANAGTITIGRDGQLATFPGNTQLGSSTADDIALTGRVTTDIEFKAGANRSVFVQSTALAGNNLTISAASSTGSHGGWLNLYAGTPGATGGSGGKLTAYAGSAQKTDDGGDAEFGSGGGGAFDTGGPAGAGGDMTISAAGGGAGGGAAFESAGRGGVLTLSSGSAGAGAGSNGNDGGLISLAAGSGTGDVGAGGSVEVRMGAKGPGYDQYPIFSVGATAAAAAAILGTPTLQSGNTVFIEPNIYAARDLFFKPDAAGGGDHQIAITTIATAAAPGGTLTIAAGEGATTGSGGLLVMRAGAGGAAGPGGTAAVYGGTASAGVGGNVAIEGGAGTTAAGDATLKGGNASAGAGGDAEVFAGNSTGVAGGNVMVRGGTGTASGFISLGDANTSSIKLYQNTVVQSGATLSAVAGGMIDLPLNFEINNVATDSNGGGSPVFVSAGVTANNLNILTDGASSNASDLHTHVGLSGATTVVVALLSGEAIVGVGTPVYNADVAGTAKSFNVDETNAGGVQGPNAGNIIGLAATAPGAADVAFNAQVGGAITIPAATFVTQPVAANAGKKVYASKTDGKLTLDVSAFVAGDTVQKVGILISSNGAALNVVHVQVGDLTVL